MDFPLFIRWFLFVLLAFLILHSVAANPLLPHQLDELGTSQPQLPRAQYLHRRQSSFVPITGITNLEMQPRLEIRQLEQNEDQWNLYILGLAKFQATNQSEKTSYYQIAGIHGRPFIPWDGVQSAPGVDSPGFCAHVSNLFLTWHRPYLALYEQVLHQHIVDIVNGFPAGHQRERYASAASSWRLPYWDWAATPSDGGSVYPTSVTSPTINVTMPNGTTTIANPLFSYQFHPVSAADFYYNPFAAWNETKRYPTSWDVDAVSQNKLVAPILDNNRVSISDRLYNLFTNYNNFTQFGNEAWMAQGNSNADSIESIHDAIHSIVGTRGHMSYLDYSAFDPIFWLHHAMVDRCFALWQAIYNESYVEPMAAVEQTFAFPVGAKEDVNSPLEPFHRDISGNFWTSQSVRSVRTLGYTYADLGNGSITAIKANINKLYANTKASSIISRRDEDDAVNDPRKLFTNGDIIMEPKVTVLDDKQHEYLANILSSKHALNQSYAVYLFLGDFEDNPYCWPLSPSLVGTHAVFASLSNADVASSAKTMVLRTMSPVIVTGTIPLTSKLLALVQSGELSSMDIHTVSGYLAENLKWRIGTFDESQVSVEEFSDLVITVVTAEVEPAVSMGQFPTWGAFTELHNVTHGKSGGC
ncbi:Di-copper centre-containing protein [Acrodontium crateriforme]|uniref:Di-copper centre-containing protein n=1 Tax=Acrodontium crateriforme TaxID=150365 RepID=A0AAQ3M2U8_9PEZI|nr:Di-copper centre-containing protein [Acrodontium crateriforme]